MSKRRCRAALDAACAALPRDGAPDDALPWLAAITAAHAALDRPGLQVTLFGALKAGKSTLLNALLGANWLPTRAHHSTAVITRLSYAPEFTATAVRVTPGGKHVVAPVPPDELERTALLDLAALPSYAPDAPVELHLGIPAPFLRDLCAEIVDTPGLLDGGAGLATIGGDGRLAARTRAELARTDLAVWVLAANHPGGAAGRALAARAQAWLNGNVALIVNWMDAVPPRRRLVLREWAAAQKLGNELVGRPRVFTLSALEAWSPQTASAVALDELRQWLCRLLHAHGDELARRARLGVLARRVAEARAHAAKQIARAPANDAAAAPSLTRAGRREYYARLGAACESLAAAIAAARGPIRR